MERTDCFLAFTEQDTLPAGDSVLDTADENGRQIYREETLHAVFEYLCARGLYGAADNICGVSGRQLVQPVFVFQVLI